MILAATDPTAGSTFTATSVLSALAVGAFFTALLIYAAWTTRNGRKGPVERLLDEQRHKRAAGSSADDDEHDRRGIRTDEQIRLAVTEHEDAYSRRPQQQHASTPKRLEGGRR